MPDKQWLDDRKVVEFLFTGKQVTSRPGFIAGLGNYTAMKNCVYLSAGVGIETRNGTRRFNGTAVGTGSDIDKVYQHLYTRGSTEYQDLYAITAERKLYEANSIPEASNGAGSLGSSLLSFTAGAGIPSMASVEDAVIAVTGKDVVGYQGTEPYCDAFYYCDSGVGTADTAADEDAAVFEIMTDEVTDENTTTKATFTLDTQANGEAIYVGFFQPISGAKFYMGASTNNNDQSLTVERWIGAAWSAVSGQSDDFAAYPFDQTGTISWTYAGDTEVPRRLNGFTLFWYRITTNAVLDEVDVTKITVVKPWADVTDVTDGLRFYCTGFLWYDDSESKYLDYWPEVIDGNTTTYASFTDAAADTDIPALDDIYIGFPVRVMGLVVDVVNEYGNDGQDSTLTVSFWSGSGWSNYNADEIADGTKVGAKTLGQSGEIRLEDKGTLVRSSTLGGTKIPMYWYRLTFSALLYNDANDEMRIWRVRGIPAPKIIKNYSCCLSFKGRLFLFGREDIPNVADYSSYKKPFALSGYDSSSVQPKVTFGDGDKVTAAANFYNEALVFKRTETWMMEGDSPASFGTLLIDPTVGCVAPETVKLVKMWIVDKTTGRGEYRNVVLFQAYDGIYACDGIKCFKISNDIDNYFDSNKTEAIKSGYRDKSRAWYDSVRSHYHLVIWSGATPDRVEFIFNTELQRWAGPVERGVEVLSGSEAYDSNYDVLLYGGGTDGRLYHLECNSYSDVDASGDPLAIDSYVEMADLFHELRTLLAYRQVFVFGETQSSGDITVKMLPDAKSTAITLGTISMINTGYGNFKAVQQIGDRDSSGTQMDNKCQSARFRFGVNTAGVKMNLYGFSAKRDVVSESAQ